MHKHPTWLFDAAASRAIDARAIAELDLVGYELMQRAAKFTFDCLLGHWPGVKRVTVCCGKGNNAGDAYLVGKLAHEVGLEVQVLTLAGTEALKGDALQAARDAQAAGLEFRGLDEAITGEVVVDGLLGTGVRGEVTGEFRAAIEKINASGLPVLAVDVPSGIHTDTGAVGGDAVRAAVTASFITRKVGLYTGAGVSYAGKREYSDLGVPSSMIRADDAIELMSFDPHVLPALETNTYKHRQGHVLIVGGDHGMPGAVAMAAEAALRVGAGMVTVATRREHAAPIVARTPEVMVADADGDGIDGLFGRVDLLILGPGLGRADWGREQYVRATTRAAERSLPAVVDADGLFWQAELDDRPQTRLIVTPHIAEAARLLGTTAGEVQGDRLAAARALRTKYGACGVLKGAGSVLFDDAGLAICAHGNPGMASAGMGDVLSGIVGGLAVQSGGDSAWVRSGVLLHSAAGDLAAGRVGQRSLVATDVTAAVPELLRGG